VCFFTPVIQNFDKREKKYEKFTSIIKERKLGFASNLTYLHPRLMGAPW
jgi:hypothetical protein